MTWSRELDQWGHLLNKKDAEIAELRRQLEQERDLTEWMKHALSEQAWHFRATLEALQLQYKHDQKREFKDVPVEATKSQSSVAVFGMGGPNTALGHGYAEGQRS